MVAKKESEWKRHHITGARGIGHPVKNVQERGREIKSELKRHHISGSKGVIHPIKHFKEREGELGRILTGTDTKEKRKKLAKQWGNGKKIQ